MKAYFIILSSIFIISCSKQVGGSHIIYDKATISQLSDKNSLKEQKSHEKAVKRKREELAVYENHAPTVKKPKKRF
jgi:hypothetical protein